MKMMKTPTNAWELPWRGKMVPHAVLDILRGCNISCRACYNTDDSAPKPVAQVERELDDLLQLRRLSSVSILGGEVTLHPELLDIIRSVRRRGLDVELVTNGLDVDPELCRQLRDAGLNIIYFHIERGQQRPDLPESTAEAVRELRREKVRMAGDAGLDTGLTVTAFPGEFDDVRDAVSLTLETPGVNYLLVTLYRDNSGIKSMRGNILDGFAGEGVPSPEETRQDNREMAVRMHEEFGFEPFGCMSSNLDTRDPRWLSYLIGVVYDGQGGHYAASVRPSMLEKAALLCSGIFKGRYPMYFEQDPDRFRRQLSLNGILGGDRKSNRKLLERAGRPGAQMSAKRLLFQNPAELSGDGQLIYCRDCPDAVMKEGKLAPVCCADHVQVQ